MKNTAACLIGIAGMLMANLLFAAPPPPSISLQAAPVDAGIFGSLQGQWLSSWEMVKVEKKYAGFLPLYHTVFTGPVALTQDSFKTYLIPQDFSRKPNNTYVLRAYRGLSRTTCSSGVCQTEYTAKYCNDLNDLAYHVALSSTVEQIAFVPYGFVNSDPPASGLGNWIKQGESYQISSPSADTMVWTETQSGKRITFKKQKWLVTTIESDCASAQ